MEKVDLFLVLLLSSQGSLRDRCLLMQKCWWLSAQPLTPTQFGSMGLGVAYFQFSGMNQDRLGLVDACLTPALQVRLRPMRHTQQGFRGKSSGAFRHYSFLLMNKSSWADNGGLGKWLQGLRRKLWAMLSLNLSKLPSRLSKFGFQAKCQVQATGLSLPTAGGCVELPWCQLRGTQASTCLSSHRQKPLGLAACGPEDLWEPRWRRAGRATVYLQSLESPKSTRFNSGTSTAVPLTTGLWQPLLGA